MKPLVWFNSLSQIYTHIHKDSEIIYGIAADDWKTKKVQMIEVIENKK